MVFNIIYDYLEVVEYCVLCGIYVMVEKLLVVNLEYVCCMVDLVKDYGIYLFINYEISWYVSNVEVQCLFKKEIIGDLCCFIFYIGYFGFIEIGCNEEFVIWFIDFVLNGGGVLIDFGCYGVNLVIWFMQGEVFISVFCVKQ